MKLLPLILKNVFRKKTRSILTIGSILLPLFVICIMGTMIKAGWFGLFALLAWSIVRRSRRSCRRRRAW